MYGLISRLSEFIMIASELTGDVYVSQLLGREKNKPSLHWMDCSLLLEFKESSFG